MAQAYNIPIANGGGWPHHNMHLIAGVPTAVGRVPRADVGDRRDDLRRPTEAVRGTVKLTEQPGLGLTPNEQALKETQES
jgi:L-alanine-DL-glutamate epimerase-like enolase superfamily enzyme